jgi:cytochrome c oxidase subunit 4
VTTTEHHLAHDDGEAHALEHAHPGAKTYVIVGVILAVITVAEVFFYTQESVRTFLVPLLLVLSASKFVLVVGFYMHLRYDARLFTGVFGFGLIVAGSIITALMFLFGQYPLPHHVG